MKQLANRQEFSVAMPSGVVAEVGVYDGEHASIILEYNKPKLLYLIDPWIEKDDAPPRYEKQSAHYERLKLEYRKRSDVKFYRMMSLDAVHWFGNEFFDWIYIDADHSLDAVRTDLRAWWSKVKIGGFLAGHDYMIEPCTKYPFIQVREAVDEFLVERGLSLSYLTEEKFASWAIQKLS